MIWAGVALLLAGCGSHGDPAPAAAATTTVAPENPAVTGPVNRLTHETLQTGVLRIDVPAGEWRILHLDWGSFAASGETVQVRIASDGQPGAHPWGGFCDQVLVSETAEPLAGRMYLAGFREGEPDSLGYQYSYASKTPGDTYAETIYIVGSNDAASTFYLGVVPNVETGVVLPDPSPGALLQLITGEGQTEDHRVVLEEFKRRAPVSARLDAGSGGFGVAYKRYYAPNGDLIQVQAGRARFDTASLAAPGAGLVAQQSLSMQLDEILPGHGVIAMIAYGFPQAGTANWSYQLDSPGLNIGQSGVTAVVAGRSGGTSTGEGTSTKVGGVLQTLLQGEVEAGPARYVIDYSISGREGGGADGNASGASSQAGGTFYNLLGYINADFRQMYGWEIRKDDVH